MCRTKHHQEITVEADCRASRDPGDLATTHFGLSTFRSVQCPALARSFLRAAAVRLPPGAVEVDGQGGEHDGEIDAGGEHAEDLAGCGCSSETMAVATIDNPRAFESIQMSSSWSGDGLAARHAC
jgi:hypothetical protein